MSRILYQGKIDGEFEGFDDEMLFKMMDGTYWIQARYEYWYHYAYCPDATLTEENGHFILTVVGRSIEVHPLTDVIESRIDGTFEGWQCLGSGLFCWHNCYLRLKSQRFMNRSGSRHYFGLFRSQSTWSTTPWP